MGINKMMYVLAVIFPPLVPLFKGKFGHFFLNILLCLLAFLPGIVHACYLIHKDNADKREEAIITAIYGANGKSAPLKSKAPKVSYKVLWIGIGVIVGLKFIVDMVFGGN
jgi:uncharacterized membrane protein YqaE (UPF0057 family)